jgi:hypothetical protein
MCAIGESGEEDLCHPTKRLLLQILQNIWKNYWGGFQVTQALYVAAKLNIFDVLRDGAKSSDEIARAVGAHAPSLLRLLRLLVRTGVLTNVEGERFAATPMGELLRSDHPDALHSLAILYGSPLIWRPHGELYESVVSGERAFERVYGAPFFEHLERNQEDAWCSTP